MAPTPDRRRARPTVYVPVSRGKFSSLAQDFVVVFLTTLGINLTLGGATNASFTVTDSRDIARNTTRKLWHASAGKSVQDKGAT